MADVLNFILYSAIPFIFALGILIFVHELGHFLLAKLVGIRVERFSLGYPPRMFGKKIGDTDYCISWIPLGGYVKLAGMIDESLDETSIKGEPWEFMSKPVYQRFLVIFAGPLMNVLLAVVFIAGFAYFIGIGELSDKSLVGSVLEEKPAAMAGIEEGDRIVKIDDKQITSWDDIVESLGASQKDSAITVVWQSDDQEFYAKIVPYFDENQQTNMLGIGRYVEIRQYGLVKSIGHGFTTTWRITVEIFKVIGKLFTKEVELKNTVAGPVSIFKMIGKSAQQGWQDYLMLIALISLNLGIFNILPIPVLDGGHIVYLLVEAVIRRPIPTKTKLIIQQIGMALLIFLIVWVTINDIRR